MKRYTVPTKPISFEALFSIMVNTKEISIRDNDTLEELFTIPGDDEYDQSVKDWIKTIKNHEIYHVGYSDNGLSVYVKLPDEE